MKEDCCETYQACGHNINRKSKLCVLTESHRFNTEKLMPLVNDPKYICSCCGRVANSEDNLCEPVELKK